VIHIKRCIDKEIDRLIKGEKRKKEKKREKKRGCRTMLIT
jgi:hypothetical protein